METDPGERPTPGDTGGLNPDVTHDQELLDFLASAPDSLREWADARAAEVLAQRQPDPLASEEPALDPADLALAELGEHDDEAPRPRVAVHTPTDRPVTPQAADQRPRLLVPLLGLLLVVAVVFGVYQVGRPADTAAPGATTQQTQAQDNSARIAELQRQIQAKPDDVIALLELGVLVFNNGDVAQAKQLWTKVTEIDPTNAQAWFNLGFVFMSEDPPNMDGVREAWGKVIDVAPDSDIAATARRHLEALERRDASAGPSPSASASQGR